MLRKNNWKYYCRVKKTFNGAKLIFKGHWYWTASLIDLEKFKLYILDLPACFLIELLPDIHF